MNNFWIFRAFPYNNNQILHFCVRGTCFALVHSWLGIRVCLSVSMFSSLTSSCAQRPQRYDILRAVLIRVAVRRGLREQATERVVHRTGNLYVFVRDDINVFHINDVRVGCSRLCQEICCGRSSSGIQDQGTGATCCGCSFPHGPDPRPKSSGEPKKLEATACGDTEAWDPLVRAARDDTS